MNPSTLSLNVIFHGLCVFIGKITGFEILLPEFPEHVYKAGVWLGETNIQRLSTMTLRGVTPGTGWLPGTAILERRKNLMVLPENSSFFPRSSAVPFATLVLPRPDKIFSLRPVVLTTSEQPTSGADLVGSATNYIYKNPADGTVVQSAIQVFRYQVPDKNQVALTNHHWTPAFVNGVANLHVFAEPEIVRPVEHSIGEFGTGAAMFQGLDLRRIRASVLPPIDPEDSGISADELEDLIPRTRRMGLLGRHRASGANPALAWEEANPLGGDPTACIWGGDGS